ncbi:MAG: MalY/PatB family protein [Anaerolineaceae bacterium]
MDFDRMFDRRHSDSVKWNVYDENVLPMWVADMDFMSPPAVLEAMHKRVEHGIFGYGIAPESLYAAVIEHQRKKYNWTISKPEISFVPGIVPGFNLAIRAVCKPGDAVIYQTPAYPPFLSAPENGGFRSVHNDMLQQPDGNYVIDFGHFEQQIIENKVKAYILCNPHNPTGRVFTRVELERLAEICLRHNVIICSDEIHCDIVYEGHHHMPIASLSPEVSAITLTFMAPSKTFNIAGLYASVAVIQEKELFQKFCKVREGVIGGPDVLALTAAEAAYRSGGSWLEECLAYLTINRDWLVENIPTLLPGVKVAKPEATFLAWLDCRESGLSDPQKFFLENAKVGLNDGDTFGAAGHGFVRFNFGTQKALVVEAVQRMADALAVTGAC